MELQIELLLNIKANPFERHTPPVQKNSPSSSTGVYKYFEMPVIIPNPKIWKYL